MKYLMTLSFFSVIFFNCDAQSIVLNEILSRNVKTLQEHCQRGGCPDWIELHNITNSVVDISQYYLSDDPANVTKWQVPAGVIIGPDEYLLLFSENAAPSAGLKFNFNLSALGETIILSDASGVEIQQVTYPPSQNDITYGRLKDGSYSFLEHPTPESNNSDLSAFDYSDSDLSISLPSGLYSGTQIIDLTHTGNGDIYYTLDGTKPTINSIPYSGPIQIDSSVALKVIVIEHSNLFSIVENRSYIIDASHELPVILLTTDNSSYSPIRKNKQVVDGRVEFVYIEADGTTAINQYANFRESGNASRFIIPQINGKIEASELYDGNDDFQHQFFPNKDLESFKSILLRNSSQDWQYNHLRDAFVSRLLSEDKLTNFPFEGYQPAVLYVNSVYHGIINIREDDDSAYIKNNFNLKSSDFVRGNSSFLTLPQPIPSDRDALDDLINFNNFTNINLLIQYTQLGELGFSWWEDVSGKTGQRFHFFMHDYDVTFGRVAGDVIDLPDPMDVSFLLDIDIEANPEFKNESLQFVAAAINHLYNTDRALGILDKMQAELESEMTGHAALNNQLNLERIPPFSNPPFTTLGEWEQNMDVLRNNISRRIDTDIFNRIQTEYGLNTPITVTHNSSDINMGFISVHEIKIQEENSNGTYFSNIPLKLNAEALPGFRFVRWEGDFISTDPAIAPTFNSNSTVIAVFETIPFEANALFINEVQAKNDNTIADEQGEYDDWVEIYNPSSNPINLAGSYFSDNPSIPLKWRIPDTDSIKTTVSANGYLLLWADNDIGQGENHLGFKLKKTDEVIWTYDDATTEKQVVEFESINTGASYGAETDGSTTFMTFTTPTPNASNSSIVSIENIATSDVDKATFSIHPNPSSSIILIKSESEFETLLNWEIYTMEGKFVKKGIGNKVDVKPFAEGIYFIVINQKETIKINVLD